MEVAIINTFERELRKLFGNDTVLTDTKFIGRVCYGKLNDNINARIEFVTHGTHEQYEGLKTTLINKNDGVIDQSTILFNDFIGPHYGSNMSGTKGIPYLRTYDGNTEWSRAYKPTREDYDEIRGLVGDYLDMFRGPEQTMDETFDESEGQSMGQSF